jgi:hypothetical protein
VKRGAPPLKVGVTLDSACVPAWVAWILDEIEARPALRLELVMLTGEQPRPQGLFSVYETLDRRLFSVEPDALAPVDVSSIIGSRTGDITGSELDVLLWLASGTPDEPILSIPRHGVWRYRHGAGEPPFFRELAAGEAASESVLEVAGGGVIYRSVAATDVVSLHRNRVAIHWKSARFMIRRLEDLARGDWQPNGVVPHEPPPEPSAPSGVETLRHVGTIAARATRRKLHNAAFQHQWFLGVRPRTRDRMPYEDPGPWCEILPPPDRSYADPFIVAHDGEAFLFVEVLEHSSCKGRLAVGRLEADGGLTDVEPILPMAHHTSYPYVFRDGGRMFMIPETGEARKVELYAAAGFPTGWEPVATLLEGVNAVDATVHAHAGRYWMWVTIAVPGGRLQDETFLYSSDRLDGGWTPHPRSPVVSDARRARPAGRPFVCRGSLIRPSQNCTGRYGERIVFNEVEVLTGDDYRERPCGWLGPEWASRANLAAHTYTFDGDWEATDGLRTFPRLLGGRG